jgi:hypothetical protein
VSKNNRMAEHHHVPPLALARRACEDRIAQLERGLFPNGVQLEHGPFFVCVAVPVHTVITEIEQREFDAICAAAAELIPARLGGQFDLVRVGSKAAQTYVSARQDGKTEHLFYGHVSRAAHIELVLGRSTFVHTGLVYQGIQFPENYQQPFRESALPAIRRVLARLDMPGPVALALGLVRLGGTPVVIDPVAPQNTRLHPANRVVEHVELESAADLTPATLERPLKNLWASLTSTAKSPS